jgi:hypothetical protein
LSAIALLVAIGLESLPNWPGNLSRSLAVGLALLNVYIVLRIVLPAYWPPPQMAFSDAVKTLAPATSSGTLTNELIINRGNTCFVMSTDLPTTNYNYFTCTLGGSPNHGVVTGALALRFCGEPDSANHKIQFNWLCDGADDAVIVALWSSPDWSDRLTEVRLNPVDAPDENYFGLAVHIGPARILGSVSSLAGP